MRTVILFLVTTFTMTWSFWFLAAAYARGAGIASAPEPGLWTLFLYLGTFSPAFVALAMTWRHDGSRGVRTLLARLIQWNVAARWYLFAIGFMATVKLTAAVVHRGAFGTWPSFGDVPIALMFAGTVFSVLAGGQTGEEIGWRGYALPRLAVRTGLGWASVILGAVWAFWHLPLFYIFPFADTNGQSFPLYTVQVVALSVALSWLWWRTNGSLLLTMLLHSAVNNTKDIVPSAVQGATAVWGLSTSRLAWIGAALLWLCAAAFLFDMRRRIGGYVMRQVRDARHHSLDP